MWFGRPTCSLVSLSQHAAAASRSRRSRTDFRFSGRLRRLLNQFKRRHGIQPDAEGGDGFTLNFETARSPMSPKPCSGDILGVGYVIDPRAQGTITLSSGRPIAKKDMLFVLENALRANNLLLVRETVTGIGSSRANDGSVGATDRGGGSNSAEPGYGLTVVPLRYVSGETLSRLLEGFAARPGAIRTDPSGRILLVLGTGTERQSALDTVRSFDVDWMRGQSVGMYPVRNSDPQPIVTELEKIMDSGDAGLGHGLVKFQSVASSNAILVVAAKPELLRTAAKWISRLDSGEYRQRGRRSLQGALRRRQADRANAERYFSSRRGCLSGFRDEPDRARLGRDRADHDRAAYRRQAE